MPRQITRWKPKLLVCEGHHDDDDDEEDREVERGKRDFGHEILPLAKLNLGSPMKKKNLLVLQLNKFLASVVHSSDPSLSKNGPKPFGAVGQKLVFKRPFCDEFLEFCFERFDVGIWGSPLKRNIDLVLPLLFDEGRSKLLFVWGQEECTKTELRTLENRYKPIFLKELKKLWNKNISHPWPKGRYTPSNTLLMDASPYRALLNPPHSAIFPKPYMVEHVDDDELGANGGVRGYLEGVAGADDVPSYVKSHPFGQTPLSPTHPQWKYYSRILPK